MASIAVPCVQYLTVLPLEFPTVADAQAWYQSPAYQAALPHRKKAADYRVIIVQGM